MSELNPMGADSRVNHQSDAHETGEADPLRWRRGWGRGSRSGWICVAMADEQEDRVGRVATRSESQAGARKSGVDRDRVMNLGMISPHPSLFIHFILCLRLEYLASNRQAFAAREKENNLPQARKQEPNQGIIAYLSSI